jgi:hypothetical protein
MSYSPLRGYELEYMEACRTSSRTVSETGTVPYPTGDRIALAELGKALLEPTVSQRQRDEAWAVIVSNTRRSGDPWMIIAIGLALPGLRNAVKRATPFAPHFQDRAELESAAIAGFVGAIADINTAGSRICARLCNRAYVAARRCAIEITRYQSQLQSLVYESHPPSNQFGHIDLVLATAIREGIITQVQATLMIDCCIEKQSVGTGAESCGIGEEEARVELKEAKNNIANWLISGLPRETGRIQ